MAPQGQMMLPDASGVSWTIFTLHACLQPGIFSGAQAGDRDPAIVPASSFLSHHFEVFFAALGRGVVAYERRIWCVALVWPNYFFLLSIALGLGSKNLANIFLGELTSTTFHFPTCIRYAHA